MYEKKSDLSTPTCLQRIGPIFDTVLNAMCVCKYICVYMLCVCVCVCVHVCVYDISLFAGTTKLKHKKLPGNLK